MVFLVVFHHFLRGNGAGAAQLRGLGPGQPAVQLQRAGWAATGHARVAGGGPGDPGGVPAGSRVMGGFPSSWMTGWENLDVCFFESFFSMIFYRKSRNPCNKNG